MIKTPPSNKFFFFIAFSIIAGTIFGRIDTSPNWDDTGITVTFIVLTTAILGAGFPRYFWLWGLIVGGIVVGFNVVLYNNFQSSGAIIIALIGSGIGAIVRKNILADSLKHPQ